MRRRTVLLVVPLLALTGCTAVATPGPTTASPIPAVTHTTSATTIPVALPSALTTPSVRLPVVGTAAGTTQKERGSLSTAVDTLQVTITCQGDGFPSIHTSDGFTANSAAIGVDPPTPGAVCGATSPKTTTYGLAGMSKYGKLRYSITPHGDIVWAITFAQQS